MARSWMTNRGSPFSSALGRRVSKSTTGSGAIAHRNAIADVSIGSFTGCLLPLGTVAVLCHTYGTPSRFSISAAMAPLGSRGHQVTQGSLGGQLGRTPGRSRPRSYNQADSRKRSEARTVPSNHRLRHQRLLPGWSLETG